MPSSEPSESGEVFVRRDCRFRGHVLGADSLGEGDGLAVDDAGRSSRQV